MVKPAMVLGDLSRSRFEVMIMIALRKVTFRPRIGSFRLEDLRHKLNT